MLWLCVQLNYVYVAWTNRVWTCALLRKMVRMRWGWVSVSEEAKETVPHILKVKHVLQEKQSFTLIGNDDELYFLHVFKYMTEICSLSSSAYFLYNSMSATASKRNSAAFTHPNLFPSTTALCETSCQSFVAPEGAAYSLINVHQWRHLSQCQLRLRTASLKMKTIWECGVEEQDLCSPLLISAWS